MQVNQPNLSVTFTYKDLLFRKLYNAIICSVISQILILQLCMVIIKGDPLYPSSWCTTIFNTVTSFTTWLYVIPHITIIFAQCLICAKDYVLSSNFCSTRFKKILSVFSLHNLVLLSLHSLVGVLQVWLILSLTGGDYKGVTKRIDETSSVLVEETLFLLIGGLWIGMYFFVKVYMSDKHLVFPVIHQKKLTQFKSNVMSLLKSSFKQAVWPCMYFIMFYYCWGLEIKRNFAYMFNLQIQNSYNSKVYFYHWLFAALIFFNLNLIKLFFSLFLTEPSEFPLVKPNQNVLTLQESINLDKLPIVQSLACLDLYFLSLWCPFRRQILFTLSQPGEHPHNWNSLIEAILKLYRSYIEILDKSTENLNDKSILQVNSLIHCQNNIPKFRNLRNMSSPYSTPESPKMLDINRPYQNTTTSENRSENLLTAFQNKLSNTISILKTITGINYIFGEIPQASIQQCLSNGHLIIWSSQGLSELICASLKEDRYGVVQKDLPGVISTLVNLNQVLDKLNRFPALSRRIVGSDNYNYKMKNAVSSSLKRSLFHICNTFRNYLSEIPLSKEVSSYLQSTILVKN
ncbi:hypothetical protein WA026_018139 [Henosepilachna vigintioctopunctata]|uniref:Nucleoporin NDC1 n=1 Tax=Henosepilachna vigintioctopunctata TaxID=420089 RepID=A0AAW1UPP9_9CUCU